MSRNTICYSSYNAGNAENVELQRLELNKDDRGYYLSTTYIVEDKHSIREIDIPKIRLCVDRKRFGITLEHCPGLCSQQGYINLGFGDMPIDYDFDSDGNTFMYKETIVKEKHTEMTLDEIEKKLGYKIKIVNKKE